MISRYALYDIANLSNYFHLEKGLPKGVKPHYNISPTVSAPVIINNDGTHIIKLMSWGLMAKGAKDSNSVFRYKTYNIPSEKILSRHSWEQAIRTHRCLVPANGFYELNGSGKKLAYYAQAKNKSMLSFAGVYSSWQDAEGLLQETYSVITIDANSEMPESSTRMPVLISRDDEVRWLDPTITDSTSLYDMLRPHQHGLLDIYEVSPAVHSPKPNQANLIDRI